MVIRTQGGKYKKKCLLPNQMSDLDSDPFSSGRIQDLDPDPHEKKVDPEQFSRITNNNNYPHPLGLGV